MLGQVGKLKKVGIWSI